MHWRLVCETWRNSWCVSSGPLRSQCQEGIRRGTDLLGKIPVRENGQGAGGRWESWQTTVQVKPPWKTEEGRKEGWAGNTSDWGAILGKFQQNHWGVLSPKLPIAGTSLVVQGLRLCAFTARGIGSISVWGTKIPQDAWLKTKTKKQNCPSQAPLPPRMALPCYACRVSLCLRVTHRKCGLRENVVKDFGHNAWGAHHPWEWHTIW